jgi:NDP-sugar pyrophosphorylase family protein
MEAIVLAGGLGTRLAARLNGIRKPMAPVAGRPFLEILLRQLKRAGCGRVVLSVGHLHETIEAHFGAPPKEIFHPPLTYLGFSFQKGERTVGAYLCWGSWRTKGPLGVVRAIAVRRLTSLWIRHTVYIQ